MAATTARSVRVRRLTVIGLVGGLLGALVMAVYAMVISGAYKDVGYLTPLYHIASAFVAPDAMMRSMEAAATGDSVHVDAGTAAVGVVVHMLTGAAAGAVFGALVALRPVPRLAVVAGGALWGLVVLAANALVGLPLVAAVFGGGDPIADMPSMAGWGTFTAEHLLFGVVLGVIVAMAGRDVSTPAGRTPVRSSAR